MTKLSDMQKAGRIKIAFDRAGTSNASEEDVKTFEAATMLQQSGGPEEVWKKLIKDTKWFQTCEEQAPSSSFLLWCRLLTCRVPTRLRRRQEVPHGAGSGAPGRHT